LPDIFLPLLLLLISPAIGSFLNVLIDRLPRRESILWPGSACRACGQRLGLRDLLPVLSFVASRGCCRHCGATIPPWHLYVELTAIGLAGLALGLGGPGAAVALSAALLWLLLVLAMCDVLWFRLPDGLNAALALAALAWAWAVQNGTIPAPPHPLLPQSLGAALMGAAIGTGAFWLIRVAYRQLRQRQGLGLGDVKLMAGLGALTGPWLLPHMLLLAALLALAGALLDARLRHRTLKAARALPFGSALCAATALIWLLARLPH
jgi:leader peptidase (prepilin peptidase) / N-methyltransferase